MISIIEWGSFEYALAVHLRHEILRVPLSLEFSVEEIESEKEFIHIASFDKYQNITGCFYLKNISEENIQLKQMAIAEPLQNLGFGRKIVQFGIDVAVDLGYTTMILHARENAVGFYKKLGFDIVGEKFIEIGIPHYKMIKKLK